jgi:hypothetical protein
MATDRPDALETLPSGEDEGGTFPRAPGSAFVAEIMETLDWLEREAPEVMRDLRERDAAIAARRK